MKYKKPVKVKVEVEITKINQYGQYAAEYVKWTGQPHDLKYDSDNEYYYSNYPREKLFME